MPQNPDPLKHVVPTDIASGYIHLDSLIACAGCGAVFKKKKLLGDTPPSDPVTCPLCLRTHGWEQVTT